MRNKGIRDRVAATAHHEAGHAVACHFLSLRFRSVTIEPTADSTGHVRMLARKIPYEISERRAEREAIVLLAGPLAQRRFNPRSVRHYHAKGDHEKIADWALAVGGSSEIADALIKLWEAWARGLVEMRWPLIEKVAAVLIERRTLAEAEVAALILPPRLRASG